MANADVMQKNKDVFFRLGLGAIFLANSVTAWATSADEFREALAGNSLSAHIGHADLFVKIIGVNDALLFLLILSGKYRKLAVVWGCLWILLVIFETGVRTPDFVLHIGVLALLAYYWLVSKEAPAEHKAR